ncbi:unnamed protein product [Ixodes hexagonus]
MKWDPAKSAATHSITLPWLGRAWSLTSFCWASWKRRERITFDRPRGTVMLAPSSPSSQDTLSRPDVFLPSVHTLCSCVAGRRNCPSLWHDRYSSASGISHSRRSLAFTIPIRWPRISRATSGSREVGSLNTESARQTSLVSAVQGIPQAPALLLP